MAYLILVRHGKSEWNAKGLWTGWTDIPLNDDGREEAHTAATEISDLPLDIAFTSDLSRAQETLDIILHDLRKTISITKAQELKERNYGNLTGKNKWEIEKETGEEQFQKLRRGWDVPIQNGETLKNVFARVIPYYEAHILPLLREGKNIIISAHGNSLRALVKYLDKLSDDDVTKLEIATGEVYVYTINEHGEVIRKEIRAEHENTV